MAPGASATSASTNSRMSPCASRAPRFRAAPGPLFTARRTTRAPRLCATALLSSVDASSTTMTSRRAAAGAPRAPRHAWSTPAPLKTGTTTDTVGPGAGLAATNRSRAPQPLARLHADGAVEPDGLAVQHHVLDDVTGERRVLGGLAEPLRKGHLLAERDAHRLGQRGQHRGLEDAGRDRAHTDAELGQVPRDRQRHAHDRALGGGVGGLADLAVEGRHRGRV